MGLVVLVLVLTPMLGLVMVRVLGDVDLVVVVDAVVVDRVVVVHALTIDGREEEGRRGEELKLESVSLSLFCPSAVYSPWRNAFSWNKLKAYEIVQCISSEDSII